MRRTFAHRVIGSSLIAMVLAKALSAQNTAIELPTGFPAHCVTGKVEVMLLGTYHMANPGRDDIKIAHDDVLAPARQAEIDSLTRRLAAWHPDQIAVEYPFTDSTRLAQSYASYAPGSLAKNRNEIVQVAFRLAAGLGEKAVYPIDFSMPIGNDSTDAVFSRRPDLRQLRDEAFARTAHREDSVVTATNGSIIPYLRYLNSDAGLHGGNSDSMFGGLLGAGDGSNYGGPLVLARWYERNFRIANNLTRVVRPGTKRVLVLIGSAHVPPLRAILDESPQFCPVSPLPFLQ